MADISFDDLIPTKQQSRATTESNVSFDDLVPKDAGALSAFGSGAATGVVPGITGLAGFGAGMKAAVPVALRAAAAFPVPHPLAKAAVGGGVALLGGFAGAGIGGGVASIAQDMLYELVDPEGYAKNKLAQKQHPTAYGVGNIVGSSLGMSPKVLPEIAGKVFSKPIVQRGVSAGLGGGINVAQQAMTKDHIDWTEAAAATGVGAALPSFNPLGGAAFRAGERLVPGSRRPIEMGIGPRDPELEVAPDSASRPPESPISAKTAEATGRIEANLREAELSTDPGKRLKEAAFKDTGNDTIIPQGKGHDDLLKTDPRLEQGFLTEDNTFVTRQEAKIIAENQHSDLLTKGIDPKEGFHSTDFGSERMDALKPKEEPKSAVQKEDDLYRKHQEIKQQHEDALASPDKYSKEQVEALAQQRLSVRDELLAAKLASIENPVLRKMALEAGADDVALHNLGTSNVGTVVSYLKGKFGDNHYISQLLDALNVDPNTRLFVVSRAEFESAAQELGMSPNSPALWNSSIGIIIEKNRGTNAIVAAHEIGHAALASKIEQIRALPADHPDAVRLNKLVSNIENILADVKSKIDLDKLSISSRSQIEYALSDVHEFISDGIFNPTVMQELLAIDRAAPKLGFVDKILKAVSDFFGLDSKQYTALHDLIESVGKLAEVDIPKDIDPPNLFTKGMKESEDIQRDVGKTGIAATHDSPHRFDGIFDWVLHVGRGQGAAAKGVGTYLSTSDPVHGTYKREFTDTVENQRADAEGYKLKFGLFDTQTLTRDQDSAAFMVWREIKRQESLFNFEKDRKTTRAEAIAFAKSDLVGTKNYYERLQEQQYSVENVMGIAYAVERIKEIDKKRWVKAYEYLRPPNSQFDGGISSTYHVTINANPDHIMSWDRPLKEQSEYVQQKLNPWIDPNSFAPIKWSKGADVDLTYYPGEKGETQKTYVRESKEPVEIVQVGKDASGVDDALAYIIKIPKSLEDAYGARAVNNGEVFGSIKEAQEAFAKMHKSSFDITPETTAGKLYEFVVADFEKTAKGEGINIAHRQAQVNASILFLNNGIVGHRFNSSGGQNAKYPNYVIFKDSVIETNAVTFRDLPKSRAASSESESAPSESIGYTNVIKEAYAKLKTWSKDREQKIINGHTNDYGTIVNGKELKSDLDRLKTESLFEYKRIKTELLENKNRKLFSELKEDEVVHYTPEENIPSILESGLDTTRPPKFSFETPTGKMGPEGTYYFTKDIVQWAFHGKERTGMSRVKATLEPNLNILTIDSIDAARKAGLNKDNVSDFISGAKNNGYDGVRFKYSEEGWKSDYEYSQWTGGSGKDDFLIFNKDSFVSNEKGNPKLTLASRGTDAPDAPTPAVDPKRYDPRNVVDEADLKVKGKELYVSEGAEAARKFFTDYETYRDTWRNPVKEVEDFVEININNKMADERIVINNSNVLKALVPDAVAREQVSIAIDAKNTKSLTGAAKEAADKYTGWMKDIGERALKEGVVKGLLENYVTHIVNWKDLPKGALDTFLADVFGKKFEGEPSGMTPESRFGKERTVETFHQLDLALKYINDRIAMAGKSDFRLEVKTKDIAEIYKQYASSMEKAIENKKLVDSVRQIRNVKGESLVRRITEEDPLPRGWTTIDDRQFAGFAVHPDLAPALKFAFEAKGGMILNALYNVSQITKRLNVIASLFHAKSLMEVLNSTHTPIVTPIKEIVLGVTDKSLGTELSGIRKAVNEFKEGGLGSSVDKWQRGGLVLETPGDVSKGVIANAGKFADSMISKFGPKTHILESALTATEKYTLGVFDKVTWDYLHTGGKLMTAEAYLTKAREQATKDGVPFDEAASRKEITSFINKSFGGLNWFQEARSAETEFGKRMAMAAYSPEGRKALQIMLFAPDWTISTIKAFTSALPKGFNPTKWHPIEGVKGMGTPSTQADYARLYQFKTALTYLTLINGINLITANHPIWDNKDPTRIEWPDGTSMQAMKHAMEPYHWLADPTKTLSNKLGFVPKAAVIGLTGSEYASPSAPKLVDPSLTNRAIAIGKQALPFQVSAAMSAPEGEGTKRALLGTIGLPVYGKTVEQRKVARKERFDAVREQREKFRERERIRENQ